MNKELAKQLVEGYVGGWRENNIEKIITPLAKDCVVIESHGPTYHGVEQIRKWFDYWIKEKGRVMRWDITSFYFFEEENVAFFEWDFACSVAGKNHELPGISVVKFSGDRISFLHEYRMTKQPYNWNAS